MMMATAVGQVIGFSLTIASPDSEKPLTCRRPAALAAEGRVEWNTRAGVKIAYQIDSLLSTASRPLSAST